MTLINSNLLFFILGVLSTLITIFIVIFFIVIKDMNNKKEMMTKLMDNLEKNGEN